MRKYKRRGLVERRRRTNGNVTRLARFSRSSLRFIRCLFPILSDVQLCTCTASEDPGVISIIAIPTNASSPVGQRVGNFHRFFSTVDGNLHDPGADSSTVSQTSSMPPTDQHRRTVVMQPPPPLRLAAAIGNASVVP